MKSPKKIFLFFSVYVTSILLTSAATSVLALEENTTKGISQDENVAVVVSTLQPPGLDDLSITSNINKRFLIDPRLNNANILVSTNNGVVSLSGTASSVQQAQAAIEVAGSTAGVLDIDTTHLSVGGVHQPDLSDVIITSRLRGMYIRQKGAPAPADVHIEAKDGVVYITGTVDTPDQAKQVMEMANSIPGVKRVDSNLTIKHQ